MTMHLTYESYYRCECMRNGLLTGEFAQVGQFDLRLIISLLWSLATYICSRLVAWILVTRVLVGVRKSILLIVVVLGTWRLAIKSSVVEWESLIIIWEVGSLFKVSWSSIVWSWSRQAYANKANRQQHQLHHGGGGVLTMDLHYCLSVRDCE